VTAVLQRETTTIPIVFVFVGDPVGSGFVASLANPGGNLTGFALFESAIGGHFSADLRNWDGKTAVGIRQASRNISL
jgi:hypothetical protein